MNPPASFTGRYNHLLTTWLSEHDEQALEEAYMLGKDAVAKDMSMLDVVAIHIELMKGMDLESRRASKLLGELLVPFEEMLLQTLAGYELQRQGQKQLIVTKVAEIEEKDARLTEKEHALKITRRQTMVRDWAMFAAGLGGVGFETLSGHGERPTLLILYGAMMGLPVILRGLTNGNGNGKAS